MAIAQSGAQAFDPAVRKGNIAALGDNHAVSRKLLLQTGRPASGTHGDRPAGLQVHQGLRRSASDGYRFDLHQRGEYCDAGWSLHALMNRAVFKRNGQVAARLEQGEMCGAANGDNAPFAQLDAGLPRFHANIAAAEERGAQLAAGLLHVDMALRRDVLALDRADQLSGPVVATPGRRQRTNRRESGNAPQRRNQGQVVQRGAAWEAKAPSLGRSGPAPIYYTPMDTAAQTGGEGQDSASAHFDTRLPEIPPWRRAQIPVIAATVYGVIRLLCPTLRYEVLGWQNTERVHAAGQRCIFTLWHRSILGIVWWARNRGIVVMNTTHFDGQWTRKVIERLGFGTAQGSSTRGGLRGLVTMAQRLEAGRDVAFTVDGPRGPRFVAKRGPVMLARMSGCPVVAFHVGVDHGHTFRQTWDHFLLPYPFSKAAFLVARPIYVSREATREELEEKHTEVQKTLERVRHLSESWFTLSEAERARHRLAFGP